MTTNTTDEARGAESARLSWLRWGLIWSVLTLLSAAQIYLRRWLAGQLPSWTDQLFLNVVAWLPWLAMAPAALGAARRWCSSTGSRVPRLARYFVLVQGLSLLYLGYLALFRVALLPEHAEELSLPGLLRQIAAEAGSSYAPCVLLLALILVADARIGAPAPGRAQGPAPGRVLTIPGRGRERLVPVARIDSIEAEGSYVRVHTARGSHLLRRTLGSLERDLAAHGFVRIHRSRLLNLQRVRGLRRLSHGDALVELDDGSELRVSRRYRHGLRAALSSRRAS